MDFFWKIAHKLYKIKCLKRIARPFELMSMIISSHAISAQIEIGNGSKFWHHGLGCTILQNTKIGCNCKIFQNVTIGNSFSRTPPPIPEKQNKKQVVQLEMIV